MSDPVLVTKGVGNDPKRLKLLVGGALALALVAFVVPKFLFGGGGGGDEVSFDAPTPAAPVAPAQAMEPGDVAVATEFGSRDPFIPLVATVPVADESTAESSTAGEAVPVEPQLPAYPVVPEPEQPVIEDPVWLPIPTPEPAQTPQPVAPTSPPASQRFAVLEVTRAVDGRPTARVRVDDAVMDVVPVQDFAGRFRVLSIDVDSRCGRFLYGDVTFILCEDQEIQT